MKIGLVLLFVMIFAVPTMAQFVDQADIVETTRSNSLGVVPAKNVFSLIDLSRIKWKHSYSFGYASGSGYSGSQGLWTSSMFYEFSPKLSLALNLGVSHGGGLITGDANNSATFLPGFTLDYHPSKKFQMTISVQRVTGGLGPYSYGNPYLHR